MSEETETMRSTDLKIAAGFCVAGILFFSFPAWLIWDIQGCASWWLAAWWWLANVLSLEAGLVLFMYGVAVVGGHWRYGCGVALAVFGSLALILSVLGGAAAVRLAFTLRNGGDRVEFTVAAISAVVLSATVLIGGVILLRGQEKPEPNNPENDSP